MRTRWWDLPAIILMYAILMVTSARLKSTNWADHLVVNYSILTYGLMTGLALGMSRYRKITCFLLSVVYALFLISWKVSSTLDQSILVRERFYSIVGRLYYIIIQVAQHKPADDSLLFLVTMATVFWIISVHMGFTVIRYGKAWQAIIPTGVMLVIIQTYDNYFPSRLGYLALFLFIALLFISRMNHLFNKERWGQSRTHIPQYMSIELTQAALITISGIILVVWVTPALAGVFPGADQAWKIITKPFHSTQDRMSDALASLRNPVSVVQDYFGDELSLGTGNILSDRTILTIKAPNKSTLVPRYYWKARVYDTYKDFQWSNSFYEIVSASPDEFKYLSTYPSVRTEATFSVQPHLSISNLFAPAQPNWVSRPVEIYLSHTSDDEKDITAIFADPPLQAGSIYSVRASLSTVTIAQLQSAEHVYPDWIQGKYLQLPDNFPARVHNLAEAITSGLSNPYEKVTAITQYLRDNIEYTDTIPSPPEGLDIIEWLLFDFKRGFCNYYATAEILMLRSIGIPARLAVGYAEGLQIGSSYKSPEERGNRIFSSDDFSSPDPTDLTYRVRQKDMHAWPEVYFPGLGWIEFEPTTSQATLVRPLGVLDNNGSTLGKNELPENGMQDGSKPNPELEPKADNLGTENAPAQGIYLNRFAKVGIILLLILGGYLAFMIWENQKQNKSKFSLPVSLEIAFNKSGIQPPDILKIWSRWSQLLVIEKAYMEINKALNRAGINPKVSSTPLERTNLLSEQLPEVRIPSRQLIQEYHNQFFSQKGGKLDVAKRYGRQIRKISILSLFYRIISRWQDPL